MHRLLSSMDAVVKQKAGVLKTYKWVLDQMSDHTGNASSKSTGLVRALHA